MKKLGLILLILLMAGTVYSADILPLFVRVQSDLAFTNKNAYISYINYMETNKGYIYNVETKEGFEPYIKVIGSRDTEFVNHPEYTMFYVDIDGESITHTLNELIITQDMLDAKQDYINSLQARVDALQAEKDSEQEELPE